MGLLNRVRSSDILRTNNYLFIIANISLIGFLWHFYGTITAYLEFETKVTFTLEHPRDYQYQYPGITVCFKSVIPYWRLKEKFAQLAEDVESVKKEMIARNDTSFWSRSVSQNFTKSRKTGKKLKDFYESKIKDELTVLEVLEGWGNDQIGIECKIYSSPIIDTLKSIKYCDEISPVIETINYKYRCFTFLSQLNVNNENESLFTTSIFRSNEDLGLYNENMALIAMETNTSMPLHPFDDNLNARVTIHSSKMIASPDFYPGLAAKRLRDRWGYHYEVLFSKTVSHLLEPPYKTNCKRYDKKSDTQSYEICLTTCILDNYRTLCNCLPRLGLMYNKKYLRSDDKFCANDNKCETSLLREICTEKCKPDCLQEQYTTEVVEKIPWFDFNNASAIKVGRMPVLDDVYKHSVAFSWDQLISDFGGLGGLWLGLSIIGVAKTTICWVKGLKIKKEGKEEGKEEVTRM